MVSLALNGGLRISEICALRYEDVDRDANVIHVRRAGHRKPGTKGRRDASGRSSRHRTIAVAPQLIREIPAVPAGYLFPGRDPDPEGDIRPLSTRQAQRLLRQASDGRLTFHQLRHAYATRLWSVCRDSGLVQHQLGHSRLAVTMLYVGIPRDWWRWPYIPVAPDAWSRLYIP